MTTLTSAHEMEALQYAFGQSWLREHPLLDPPTGFELDPMAISVVHEDTVLGWLLRDEDEGTVYIFDDVPGAASLVMPLAENPKVQRIELWEPGSPGLSSCVWAARRR